MDRNNFTTIPQELWELIEPLIPPDPPRPLGGRRRIPARRILGGIKVSFFDYEQAASGKRFLAVLHLDRPVIAGSRSGFALVCSHSSLQSLLAITMTFVAWIGSGPHSTVR